MSTYATDVSQLLDAKESAEVKDAELSQSDYEVQQICLKYFPEWNGVLPSQLKVTNISKGQSNLVYKVSVVQNERKAILPLDILVRVYGDGAEAIGIDHDTELVKKKKRRSNISPLQTIKFIISAHILCLNMLNISQTCLSEACNQGIAARCYSSFPGGRIEEYLDARTWTVHDARDPKRAYLLVIE
jgi:hypothetical protein